MLSHALQSVLAKAVLEMRGRKHEYLTIEHILFALTYDNQVRIILEGCGADVQDIRHQLESFLTTHLEAQENSEISGEVMQTLAVERILARSFQQVHSSGKNYIDVTDILASLFLEEESWAVHILQTQGISRLDILEFISHRMPDAPEKQSESEPKEEKEQSETVLGQYCTNLLAKAKLGEIDPIVGREAELLRMIEILARRRKNNPLLVGEAGTGKTAIIEGLALRIAQKKVPEEFRNVKIYSLDIASLFAGAKYRGEFEGRLKSILTELSQEQGAILVIDEIHSLVSASGASSGGLDASHILKPFLTEGQIRFIGSTTHEDLRNSFNKDRGLSRRFQKIDIVEPSQEETVDILKGLQKKYEEHHKVRYSKAVLSSIVELSSKYIQERMLPDKAIDVLDEAGASLRLKPAFKINTGVQVRDVERVVARMANIPPASVTTDEKNTLKSLEPQLKSRIFGQDQAVELITRAIIRSRANLGESKRPAGSFLFHGPTGVGKTELAKNLAEQLGIAFLRFDMSEYMEKHAVARLIGSPPGYIGFEQGGQLTESVRKNPHAILLLDEIEKAHQDIYNILLQVMDYATLTDNTGKKADFRNIFIIMTTNAGARELEFSTIGFSTHSSDNEHKSKKAVENTFAPEFRNRLDALIPFKELTLEHMIPIVNKSVQNLFKGLTSKKIKLHLTNEAKEWLAIHGFDPKLGARPLERLIRVELEDYLATESLFGKLTQGGNVEVSVMDKNDPHLIINVI